MRINSYTINFLVRLDVDMHVPFNDNLQTASFFSSDARKYTYVE
jgi:hypothetical protein